MAKEQKPIEYLKNYLPEQSAQQILDLLQLYRVHLTVTRERASVLGDYRHSTHHRNHRISVNGNLNKYSFLITLIHEIAHLLTFEKFGNRVAAHGKEWKLTYAGLLTGFLDPAIFPQDILQALHRSLPNLPASSCADENLMRVLRKYDKDNGMVLVEEVPEGHLFSISSGNIFRKGRKLRKRYQCIEVNSGRLYLFNALYEVKLERA